MKKIPLCIDGHEDMAWNKIVFNRDYSEDVMTTRSREAGTDAPKHNGDTLLGWDAYQQGCIGLIFSTLFAAPIRRKMGDWDFLCYRDAEEAHKIYQQQVDVYQEYAERYPEKFVLVTDKAALQQVIAPWLADAECKQQHKIGLVILMENAEGVREPAELEQWWQWGVRIIGPAWAGTRFCGGTREPGPLTKEGYALLDAMADLGFALDVSHMDEEAVLQSLDHYDGTIVASHANVKALMKGTSSNRFLSDRVIEGLVERDAVIGVVPYNLFLQMGWKRGDEKSQVPICRVVEHIDHICQIAGDTAHVAFGSDADGGLGWQHVPAEIDSIADLQKIAPLLEERGYSQADIESIFYKNWIRMLESILL